MQYFEFKTADNVCFPISYICLFQFTAYFLNRVLIRGEIIEGLFSKKKELLLPYTSAKYFIVRQTL